MKINAGITQGLSAGVTPSASLLESRLQSSPQATTLTHGQPVGAGEDGQAARRSDGVMLAVAYDAGNGRNSNYGMSALYQRAANEYASNQQQQKRSEISAMLGVDYYA